MVLRWIMLVFCMIVPYVIGLLIRVPILGFTITEKTSGVTVTDVDSDGQFEIIVAVSNGPNKVLMYDRTRKKYTTLSSILDTDTFKLIEDPEGKTACICACDVTGDGKEEIYLHNNNDVYRHQYYDMVSGHYRVPDRLISRMSSGEYVDLFSLPQNNGIALQFGGHSAACIDSNGDGIYEIVVSTFTKDGHGAFKHISVHNSTKIIVKEIIDPENVPLTRVGRGLLAGPLIDGGSGSDLFILSDNSFLEGSSVYRHHGNNVLLMTNGDGTFTDVAQLHGIDDTDNNGRSAVLGDINNDGHLDLLFANWLGPTRVHIGTGNNSFQEVNDPVLTQATATEVMILQDFDDDGHVDLIKTNVEETHSTHRGNIMLTFSGGDGQLAVSRRQIQDETLKNIRITGAAVADLDGDGLFELFISHIPYNNQTFSVFRTNHRSIMNWIRVLPLTKHGSPARGAMVTVTSNDASVRTVVINGDCSYLCQSEPVAHIGLGKMTPKAVTVVWPDGHKVWKFLYPNDIHVTLRIHYSGITDYLHFDKDSDFSFNRIYSTSYTTTSLPTTLIIVLSITMVFFVELDLLL